MENIFVIFGALPVESVSGNQPPLCLTAERIEIR